MPSKQAELHAMASQCDPMGTTQPIVTGNSSPPTDNNMLDTDKVDSMHNGRHSVPMITKVIVDGVPHNTKCRSAAANLADCPILAIEHIGIHEQYCQTAPLQGHHCTELLTQIMPHDENTIHTCAPLNSALEEIFNPNRPWIDQAEIQSPCIPAARVKPQKGITPCEAENMESYEAVDKSEKMEQNLQGQLTHSDTLTQEKALQFTVTGKWQHGNSPMNNEIY